MLANAKLQKHTQILMPIFVTALANKQTTNPVDIMTTSRVTRRTLFFLVTSFCCQSEKSQFSSQSRPPVQRCIVRRRRTTWATERWFFDYFPGKLAATFSAVQNTHTSVLLVPHLATHTASDAKMLVFPRQAQSAAAAGKQVYFATKWLAHTLT